MKYLFIFSLLLGLFGACESCKNGEAPALYLNLSLQDSGPYFIHNENGTTRVYSNSTAKLPFNLNSDTTTYLFLNMKGTVVDTLSIGYTRETSFEGTGCGFSLSVKDTRILPATTFDSVKSFHPEPFLHAEINVYD